MITLYSGTPGSGKSLHLARRVADEIKLRKNAVIANFPINTNLLSKNGRHKIGNFIYLPNDEITVPYLIEYAQKNHVIGKEGQTLLVIDEAGIMFNSRDYGQFDRKSWIHFFMTHRHFGYDVILVSQIDRMIDRQIRGFIEYDVKHRKANNYKAIGLLLSFFRIPVFVAITYWYGMRERCSSELFFYRRRDSKLYDTMMLFGGDRHGERAGKTEKPPPDETPAHDSTMAAPDVPDLLQVGDTELCEEGAPPAASQTNRVKSYVLLVCRGIMRILRNA